MNVEDVVAWHRAASARYLRREKSAREAVYKGIEDEQPYADDLRDAALMHGAMADAIDTALTPNAALCGPSRG